MNIEQTPKPKPQNPRKIAAAVVKAIKAPDSVCRESHAQDYTSDARQELFDALDELGYFINRNYELTKKV